MGSRNTHTTSYESRGKPLAARNGCRKRWNSAYLVCLIAGIPCGATWVTCSPKTDPVTMRVRQPQKTGVRRTLYGQTTLAGADRSQAPPSGGKAGRWNLDPGGGQGARHKRGYVPSLEKPIRCDEHLGGQAPQGAGGRECSPQEDRSRSSCGHRHPKGGEPKKLLSPTRRRTAVEHVRRHLGVSERRACEAIGQPRSTQRYVGRPKAELDRALVEPMVGLSRANPRSGYR